MKIAEKCKVAVVGLSIAAVLASCPVALAVSPADQMVSPAGYTSLTQIEEENDADPAKVQAIKDAMANIKKNCDEKGSWDFQSNYEDFEIDNRRCFVMPWLYLSSDYTDVHFSLMFMSQDDEGFFYWTKTDLLTEDYDNPKYTASYEFGSVSRTYATEDKNYVEIAAFTGDESDIEVLTKILSAKYAWIRFNGNTVNGRTRSTAMIVDQETRQGITDIINLYRLLKDATPEERAAAINS